MKMIELPPLNLPPWHRESEDAYDHEHLAARLHEAVRNNYAAFSSLGAGTIVVIDVSDSSGRSYTSAKSMLAAEEEHYRKYPHAIETSVIFRVGQK